MTDANADDRPPLLRCVLDTMPGVFFAFPPEGKIQMWNHRLEEVTGYAGEKIAKMHPTDLLDREASQIEKWLQEAPEEGRARFEASLIGKEGARKPYKFTASLFRGDTGEVLICQGGRPLPEDPLSEETEDLTDTLEERELRFRRLFEEAQEGIAVTTPEGRVLAANPATREMFGYGEEELSGLEAPDLYADLEKRKDILEELRREGSIKRREVRFERAGGEEIVCELSMTTQKTGEGEPALIFTFLRDVTERKKLQKEVLQVQEEERRQIGQDLHDSVASQLVGVNLLLRGLSGRPEAKEIAEELKKAQSLIKESAGEVRRLSHGLSPGGLSEGDLLSALKSLAQSTEEARFEALLEDEATKEDLGKEDLEEPALEEEVATHLYRIAQEAISNARRHGEADIIEVRLRQENSAIILEIEDDGKGFNLGEVSQGSPKEGLGLRSMRRRAELLGAKLKVESSRGEGTLVRLRLPV